MKKSSYKLISCIIGAVFLFSLLIFIANIISDSRNGIEQADKKYKALEASTAAACQKFEPTVSDNRDFASEFLKGIDNISDWADITLTVNNQVIYHYPPVENVETDPEVVKSNETQFISVYGNTVVLKASVYKVNPSLVYYRARIPFLLILAGTVIAIILLVITGIPSDSKDEEEETEEYEIENVNFEKSEEKFEAEESPVEEESFYPEEETPVDENNEPDLSEVTYEEETSFNEPEEFGNSTEQAESKSLNEVLDEELVEAASTEQDITLLIIKINHLNKESPAGERIKEEIKSKYFQQGLVFDFNSDSYAVIIRNAGLDAVMVSAEELRETLLQTLSENEITCEVTMGISARSVRMINAERLITEADQAQQHSDADSPIIAFRVNPEKYRQFILNS